MGLIQGFKEKHILVEYNFNHSFNFPNLKKMILHNVIWKALSKKNKVGFPKCLAIVNNFTRRNEYFTKTRFKVL